MPKTFIQNIVGGFAKSDISNVGLSQSINMYEETTSENQHYVNKILRSINGMETLVNIEGDCRGIFTVSRGLDEQPTTYTVYGNTLYLIFDNVAYEIAKIAEGSSICHFTETGGYGSAHPHLIIVDGLNVYAVNTGLTIIDQKSDFRSIKLPLRPGTNDILIKPSHCAYLYGYLIVNDSGTDAFYTSYQYPFETNIGTEKNPKIDYDIFRVDTEEYKDYGFVTYSEWQTDQTVAICSNGSRLFTFGTGSYQIFQYNNDVNNPFTSPDTAAQSIGIKAVNSLAQLGIYTLWLGSSDLGNFGVYLNTGNVECTRVSTVEIEREISTFKNTTDAIACIWQENQHVFYCISFPSANRTFVYDLREQSWHERSSRNDKNENDMWRYNFACLDSKGHLLFGTNGAIVRESMNSWTEHDGKKILRLRKGGVIYNNYSSFYIDSLEVLMNNGQMENMHNNNAYITMRFSPDGSTWSDLEVLSIGKAGDYDYDCIFYSFGMAKCFTIELSTTDDFPFTLMGLKIQTEECQF